MGYRGGSVLVQQELTSVRRLREAQSPQGTVCPHCHGPLNKLGECAKCMASKEAQEHGVQGMKWNSKNRAEVAQSKAHPMQLAQALRDENLALKSRIQSGKYSGRQQKQAMDRIKQNEEMIKHYEKSDRRKAPRESNGHSRKSY